MGLKRTMIAPTGGGVVSSTPVVIPYASTVTPDATQGSLFRIIATGPLTLSDPTGAADGRQLTVEVNASGGTRTLSFQGGAMDPITIPSGQWWVGRYRLAGTDWLVDDGPGGTYPPVEVSSVNGHSGVVVLTAGDVGADPAGTAASAVTTHAAATDPHGDRAYAAGLVSALSLADLDDVAATAPTDGQALVWDNTAGTWEPGTVAGGGGGAVDSVNGRTGAVTGLAEASDLTALEGRVDVLETPNVSLADAATVAINAAAGSRHKVTLGGSRTLGNPTGAYDGQILVIAVRQDATGGRTVTLGAKYRLPAGVTLTWSTAAGRVDRIAVQYDSADDTFDVVGFQPGFGA